MGTGINDFLMGMGITVGEEYYGSTTTEKEQRH